ncbi:MAG: hypothetical protein LC115_02265 [Bacteroidia bacterium]|nr:hypothetical protein [Bacteroidia bacterium]
MKLLNSILIFCGLLVFGCSNYDVYVRFEQDNEVVPQLGNLEFVISTLIAPQEKQNQWLSESYIEFSPEIPGKFKFTDSRTLIFSPEKPLQGGTEYTATVNEKIIFGKKMSVKLSKFHFRTPYLEANNATFKWTRIKNKSYQAAPACKISFNYAIAPQDLLKYLEAKLGNNDIPKFEIINSNPSRELEVVFQEVAQTDDDQKFTLKIKKGLPSPETNTALQQDAVFNDVLIAKDKFEILSVVGMYSNDLEGSVMIQTTQAVQENTAEQAITVSPQTNYRIVYEDQGLSLVGDFKPENSYTIKIKSGLKGSYGGVLKDPFETDVALAQINPTFRFVEKDGIYLTKGGLENIGIRAINYPKLIVEIDKIYENNLIHFLGSNLGYYGNSSWGGAEEYENDWDYMSAGGYGRTIATRTITFPDSRNTLHSGTLNLNDLADLDNFRGIYLLGVRDPERRWISKSKIVSISDLGIIAKKGKNNWNIFVQSLSATGAVSGAEVKIIGETNQVLYAGKTNEAGVCSIPDNLSLSEKHRPALIIVSKEGDFNFLHLNSSQIETSRFPVGGRILASVNYDIYLYGDRDLYRPGEQAIIQAIVRNTERQTVSGIPIQFQITDPLGRVVGEFQKKTTTYGSCEIKFPIPDYAPTGQWTVEAFTGDKQFIDSYRFKVEEFIPDKIKVTLRPSKTDYNNAETAEVSISAINLFGTPAANRNFSLITNFIWKDFESKKYPTFDFSASQQNYNPPNFFADGKLDEAGQAKVKIIFPTTSTGQAGYLKCQSYTSVFDVTGRPANQVTNYNYFPNTHFIGIQRTGYYFSVKQPINVKTIVLNRYDQPTPGVPLVAELYRCEWQNVLRSDPENALYRYVSQRKLIPIFTRKLVSENEPININFNVDISGEYELKIYQEGKAIPLSKKFYAFSYGATNYTSFAIDKEGKIDISLDKPEYSVDETAKLLFKTPFSGKILVTVEKDEVLEKFILDTDKNAAELKLPIKEKYLPNVFISATAFKKSVDRSSPLTVAHGYVPLLVKSDAKKIALTLNVPDKSRSATNLPIVISTGKPNIPVTIAVVDEGILQLSGQSAPDPYKFYYQQRALQVSSYDMYRFLLSEVSKSRTVAFGGDELKKRANPLGSRKQDLLSWWSGEILSDSRGNINIQVPLPRFAGAARVMVVSHDNDRFGSIHKLVQISDPIVVQPAIPRFLSPKDEITLPIAITNTTKQAGNVTVALTVKDPARVISAPKQTIQINSEQEKFVYFTLAAESVGNTEIVIQTSGLGENQIVKYNLPVRPISPLVIESKSALAKTGQQVSVNFSKEFLPATERRTLVLSPFPATQFSKRLSELLDYPHGCLEQTVSMAFPLLYFEPLANLVSPEKFKKKSVSHYVIAAITKIQSMQLYNGSFAYWPGATYSNWWSTIYAAHFLLEAKKAGYQINADMLDKLIAYLKKEAKMLGKFDYRYVSNGTTKTSVYANKETAYSLYVLALAGQPDFSTMNYYKQKSDLLTQDCKYLLAGAFALRGDFRSYKQLIPQQFITETPVKQDAGSFDSPLRASAVMLSVLAEVEPNHPQIPTITNYVANQLNSSSWLSTQENAMAWLAFGKIAQRTYTENVSGTVSVNGKVVKTFDKNGCSLTNQELNGSVTISLSNGNIYWTAIQEGVKASGNIIEKDQFLKVRRTYLTRTGQPILNYSVKQNNLVVCKITLQSFDRTIDNVVISDLIPAGFEIENPRLGPGTPELNWITQNAEYQYMDIRDDRVIYFTQADTKEKTYYYLLRATSVGKFQLAPIGAEAMYQKDLSSYSGAGQIQVYENSEENDL